MELVLDYEHAGRFRENLSRSGAGKFPKRFDAVIESFQFRAFGGDGATDELRVSWWSHRCCVTWECGSSIRPTRDSRRARSGRAMARSRRSSAHGLNCAPRARGRCATRSSKLQLQTPGKLRTSNARFGLAGLERRSRYQCFRAARRGDERAGSIRDRSLEGLRGDPALSFALDAQPDRPPVARLKSSGIGDKITPVTTLPLIAQASDDFGVAALSLATSTNNTTWQNQPLAGAALGNAEVHLETRLPLETVRVAEGSVLNLRAAATDAATPQGSRRRASRWRCAW